MKPVATGGLHFFCGLAASGDFSLSSGWQQLSCEAQQAESKLQRSYYCIRHGDLKLMLFREKSFHSLASKQSLPELVAAG